MKGNSIPDFLKNISVSKKVEQILKISTQTGSFPFFSHKHQLFFHTSTKDIFTDSVYGSFVYALGED